MNHFAPIIEAKSGSSPVSCDSDRLRSRLGHDIALMRSRGFDPSIIAEHEAFNESLELFIAHPQFGEYLRSLTPSDMYGASGVRVLPLDAIREEIQQLAPGTRLLTHGFMPFATSIGGNAVCFHVGTGRVVWADHSYFRETAICYKDQATGDYRTVSFTPENIGLAVVPLADDFGAFLTELLDDRLEKRLDELD
jgi:hypothetical protein